ncbi:DUF1722 domain-containing protein [Endozoicomonas sp. G2_1]|uniref:YbgA family protein n=1 Tax=Endozoicomonas sp. G2_1 TaxID=2821091 RepID=UPI001AD9DE9D|nr:DUF523 and DUF1722 domain-containing protein [Endozoicomonas sp. G2_1]MBO9491174.1 DUF1722 domain-containing protein [Endozoicomonas sp. G2_1]
MAINRQKITLGISACLMGQEVRFDRSHKKSNFCVNELGKHVQYKSYCPEVAIGLPVPRATIRQTRIGDNDSNIIKVSRPDGSGDVTDALTEYGQNVATKIDDLSGFIFTAKSPSCGMERVKVYYQHGKGASSDGVGLFAKEIMAANPLLPCEESGRLNDPLIKENFVLRVYAYHQWQCLVDSGLSKHKLFDFHSQYKYLIMSHSNQAYRELGRLLGDGLKEADADIANVAGAYIAGFMNALKKKASRKSHANTLQHLQGYFSKQLTKIEKQELTEQIDEYRKGLIPLIVPLTLIKHYLLEFPKPYLASQKYLEPYPAELKLRYGY